MNVDVTVELEINLSVLEMRTRVTRVISRCMRTNVLKLCSPFRTFRVINKMAMTYDY